MKLYIATWEDGTITIVSADTLYQARRLFDTECCPSTATIKEVDFGDGPIHITTRLLESPHAGEDKTIKWGLGDFADEASIKHKQTGKPLTY